MKTLIVPTKRPFRPHPLALAIALSVTLPMQWRQAFAVETDILAEHGVYCTTHPAVADFLENDGSLYSFYFDSTDQAQTEGISLRRSCFHDGSNRFSYYNFINLGFGSFPYTLLQTIPEHFADVLVEGETSATAEYRLRTFRTGNLYSNASLDYQITGTMTRDADFLFRQDDSDVDHMSGTLHFPAWDPDPRYIAIDILDDDLEEDDETLDVTFADAYSDYDDAAYLSYGRDLSLLVLDDDRIATRFETDYHCVELLNPLEIFQDGSSRYHVQVGSSVTQIDFIGSDGRTEADTACAKGYIGGIEFSPSLNSSNISSNGNNISINGYTPPETLPEITQIDNRDSSVVIHFNADANPIGYSASCVSVDSGHSVTDHATQSPITLKGMINGESYLCSVAHFNADSGSPAMTASPTTGNAEAISVSTLGQWSTAILSAILMTLGFLWGRRREDG